jgi:hypothetical protein
MRRNLRRNLQQQKYLQTLAVTNVRFNFFVSALSALAFCPVDEVVEYYKALVDEELPSVLADIKHQLEFEEDDATERFAECQRSIERFLEYVETTYVGKVQKSVRIPAIIHWICVERVVLVAVDIAGGSKSGLH